VVGVGPTCFGGNLGRRKQGGDEVGFERADCSFGFVASAHVGRHLLEVAFPDFSDVVEEFGTDFVVHELHVDSKSAPLETVHEVIVCWDTMVITF